METLETCAAKTGGAASFDCIPILFNSLVTGAFVFAGAITILAILYAAVRHILSGGDPKQVEGARKILTYAIIGLIVILSSFFIISLIGTITGVTCITQFGFTNCK